MTSKLSFAVILVFLLSSCVGTKTLYKGLTKEDSTLEYLFDSEENTSEKVDSIMVLTPVISDPQFTKSGNLRKVKSSVIPLIFYNGWKSEFEYSIGENVIREDVSKFVGKTVINEINRSTSFYADSTSNTGLILELEIDNLGAKGPYHSDGTMMYLLFYYSYSMLEYAGPGVAYSGLNYKLKQETQVLLEGRHQSEIPTEPLKGNFQSTKELRKFFSAQLTEALSITLKSNIESVIKDVEKYYMENIASGQ